MNRETRFTDEWEISMPLKKQGFLMEKTDWDRLRRKVKNSVEPTKWLEIVIGAAFSSFIGLLIAYFDSFNIYYFFLSIVFGIIVVLLLVFKNREKK